MNPITRGGERIGHSTRGLTTTKAHLEGKLTLQEVMAAADWKSDSEFSKFYKNQDFNPKFGREVLNVLDR